MVHYDPNYGHPNQCGCRRSFLNARGIMPRQLTTTLNSVEDTVSCQKGRSFWHHEPPHRGRHLSFGPARGCQLFTKRLLAGSEALRAIATEQKTVVVVGSSIFKANGIGKLRVRRSGAPRAQRRQHDYPCLLHRCGAAAKKVV